MLFMDDLVNLKRILSEIGFRVECGTLLTDPNVVKVACQQYDWAVYKDQAERHRDEIVALLHSLRLPSLEEGASYTAVGRDLQQSNLAIPLFAVGHVLGIWRVVTELTPGLSTDILRRLSEPGSSILIIDLKINFL